MKIKRNLSVKNAFFFIAITIIYGILTDSHPNNPPAQSQNRKHVPI